MLIGEQRHASIAIVGAGPVGKVAALLLAAQGTSVLLIEKRTEPSDEPKAISIDDESLRTFQSAGILEAVLPVIVPGLGTKYFDSDGEPLFLAGAVELGRFGYPYKNPFAQPDLERVLHELVAADPRIDCLFGHELVGLTQHAGGVELEVRSETGAITRPGASYLIGADGGRSLVRKITGIRMTGRSLPETWIVIDAKGDSHTERFGLHYGVPERPHVIVPGLEDRCRYEFRLFDGEGASGETPSFELISRLLSPYREVVPEDIERAVIYSFNGLNAVTYQEGRVFLVGDAAHMMPPFAGQGLNSGIRDAMNLCWKLTAVLNGKLTESALQSFTQERRPHAGAMIRFSQRLGTIVMATNQRVARYRDRIIREALGDPKRRRWFEEMRFRPMVRFSTGLLSGTGPLVGAQLNQPRVFDVVAGAIGLLDESLGEGWSIIGIDVEEPDWSSLTGLASAYGMRRVHAQLDDTLPMGLDVDSLTIDIDGSLARALQPELNRGRFLLLRPDRVVAANWSAAEALAGLELIGPWFRNGAAARARHP